MDYQAKAAEALSLVAAKHYQQAVPALRRLLHETYVTDFEYDDWLRGLADSHKALKQPLPAGYVYLYLHYFDMALECFKKAQSPLDLALCHESCGNFGEAATLYLRERKPVRAAVNCEKDQRPEDALAIWEGLQKSLDPDQIPYAAALVRLNWANCLKQCNEDPTKIRRALVEALVLLEAVADEREHQGLLEEALDCYHLMIQIAQEQHSFENLSEGYINAIRILQERGRLLTSLRYYAGIGEIGIAWGESHAVATLYREAAEAVQRAGTLYSSYYMKAAADAWLAVAQQNLELGVPPELSENALLAALDCFNQIDDGANVVHCYQQLSRLDLEPEKVQRYGKLAAQAATERRDALPLYPPSEILRRAPKLPPLWREDLIEWEGSDDSIALLTQVIWDLNYHDTVRRKALNLVLFYLDVRDNQGMKDKRLLLEVAKTLAHMRPKLAFRGLKNLITNEDAEVRAEVARSAGHVVHPSGLLLIEQLLEDPAADVKTAAIEALAKHGYPEAFDALKRILESHDNLAVKRQVLATMGRVRVFEAAEYLYRYIAHGHEPELNAIATQSLELLVSPDWRRILANRVQHEPESARPNLAFLEQAL
ncbi:MAG: hypothetical protein COW42_09685 [Deltaproteobacteria bacterium CG17_big_fil_post_rev_8_21_14_2_50_63_7]|nr:MAG: hypothetical protein COW42_09685 [Deltaproteobacteria bacterium CG17_big_fil_post_rev_8_21_14_2_50_63_7]